MCNYHNNLLVLNIINRIKYPVFETIYNNNMHGITIFQTVEMKFILDFMRQIYKLSILDALLFTFFQ